MTVLRAAKGGTNMKRFTFSPIDGPGVVVYVADVDKIEIKTRLNLSSISVQLDGDKAIFTLTLVDKNYVKDFYDTIKGPLWWYKRIDRMDLHLNATVNDANGEVSLNGNAQNGLFHLWAERYISDKSYHKIADECNIKILGSFVDFNRVSSDSEEESIVKPSFSGVKGKFFDSQSRCKTPEDKQLPKPSSPINPN